MLLLWGGFAMKGKRTALWGLIAAMGIVIAGCGASRGKEADEVNQGNKIAGVSVHDPSIVKTDGKYYIFGTHMSAARSENLMDWKSIADGVKAGNPVYGEFLQGDKGAFAYVGEYVDGGYAVWAPDVIYNKAMNKWTMYFSASHDWRTSSICLATADAVEGPYTFQEILISSGFTAITAENTNFYDICGEDANVRDYVSGAEYNHLMYPNCIDPCVFYDEDGKLWMVYGSWSGGIFLLELDEQTGLPIHPEENKDEQIDTYFGKHLIGGLHNSCEGPYILYNQENGYYYLFVSYGSLTREGGYQIRLFRSEQVTGPYVDAAGETFGYTSKHSDYGLKMMGNYAFPSLKTAYMAPGHNSAFQDDDGKYYVVYHQRMNSGTEYHEPRVHQMFLNEDGWFVAAPFAYAGESLGKEGIDKVSQLAGTYYYVNHGTDISADIHDAVTLEIKKNGGVRTADGLTGTVSVKPGTNYVTIQLGECSYKGVVIDMTDEAGNDVQCITAAGNNNETIWCVMYR